MERAHRSMHVRQLASHRKAAYTRAMPRRNKTPKHRPYRSPRSEATKKRYLSRAAALRAITELRKYQLDVQLRVYQSPHDGGWYLTSQHITDD